MILDCHGESAAYGNIKLHVYVKQLILSTKMSCKIHRQCGNKRWVWRDQSVSTQRRLLSAWMLKSEILWFFEMSLTVHTETKPERLKTVVLWSYFCCDALEEWRPNTRHIRGFWLQFWAASCEWLRHDWTEREIMSTVCRLPQPWKGPITE